MNASIDFLNDLSVMGSTRLGIFLWQSTLLVLLVTVAAKLLKRASPAVRFWLWQIVAVKLLLMPFWMIDAPLPAWFAVEQSPPQMAAATSFETHAMASPLSEAQPFLQLAPTETFPELDKGSVQARPQIAWQTWLLALWLAAVMYQVGRVISQKRRLHRLLLQAQPAAELEALVSECSKTLRLRRPPTTLLVATEVSPFVCRARQPTLVLPKSLVTLGTAARLRQIVLHELAHIRRRDLLWSWTPSFMQIVYWFHPAVHWVAYRVQLERELACDQLAIQHSGSSVDDYADTLIDVVSHTATRIAAQAALSTPYRGGAK